jgi:hypothetical protein
MEMLKMMPAKLCSTINLHNIKQKSLLQKAIALVEKIDNMIQRRIVVKGLGKQIDIEDPAYRKYTIAISMAWMLISVNVTIYRTVPIQRYQGSSHCIMMTTTKLRSCI